MSRYSLTHLPDSTLLSDLKVLVSQERATTALLIAHLAEVDTRRLYASAGYPSLLSWCVEELHFSEEAACRRIRAARTARQFPAIYALLADGRLHLTAVGLLAPYLTPENADELLAAATHKSRAGVEQLLAERFPRPDLPTRVEAISAPLPIGQLPPGTVGSLGPGEQQQSPGTVESPAPANFFPSPATVMSKVAPLAPGRYGLQLTIGQSTRDKLCYAQALLGHSVPSGELAQVLDRALDALIVRLEKRKFAATERPRRRRTRTSASARHVPAEVRRAVWERDGGRCTFVGESGHRCPARTRLEFDHAEPVARGGRATVQGVRLRCRAHNQYAAECAFGRDFMLAKRELAERERDQARTRAAATEVVPWLRELGLRANEARRAAACCETIPDAPLEERVRYALRCSARRPPGRAQ